MGESRPPDQNPVDGQAIVSLPPNQDLIDEDSIIFITQDLTPSAPSPFTIYTTAPDLKVKQTLESQLPGSHLHQHVLSSPPPHLQVALADLHVLVSTGSGAGKAEDFFQGCLRPVLAAVGYLEGSYPVVTTVGEDTIRSYASDVLRGQAERGVQQTVLVVAGDGGVVDIINGLYGDGSRASTYVRPKLILFPLGTGNALFHSLHRTSTHTSASPSDLTLALRTLLHGTAQPLPTFRASFSPGASLLTNEGRTALPIPANSLFGAVVASYGFHATLVADSDTAAWRVHGANRFGLVAGELLADPHRYRARVRLRKGGVETMLEREEHGYVLAAMVSNLEKTFMISPASEPLDGKLRMVHFGPVGAEVVMRIMGAAYAGGKHVGDEAVGYEEIDGFRIEFLGGEEERWRRVCVDGLIVRVEESGWMDVQKVIEGTESVDIVL